MLKQRVWTATVLILVFLAALFYASPAVWALLMGAIALGGAWEWGRLCGLSGFTRAPYVLVAGAAIFAVYTFSDVLVLQSLWLLALVFWFLLAPLWLIRHWTIRHRAFLLFIGLVVLLPTWLAFVQLRTINVLLLLFLMGLVWIADIAAYFAGRQWGKHKLAPRISPGKTWEGVAGALAAAIVYVGLWLVFTPSSLARFSAMPWWGLGLAAMLLVVISITGDLFESHLKRVAGMKDSGTLIPGHGGILDRIDSQTSVLPVAMALIYFSGLGA